LVIRVNVGYARRGKKGDIVTIEPLLKPIKEKGHSDSLKKGTSGLLKKRVLTKE